MHSQIAGRPGAIGGSSRCSGLCRGGREARRGHPLCGHHRDVVNPFCELAGDGDLGLVGRDAAHLQCRPPLSQAGGALLRLRPHGLGNRGILASHGLELLRVARRGLDEDAAQVGVPLLGDGSARHLLAAGILGGNKAEVACVFSTVSVDKIGVMISTK